MSASSLPRAWVIAGLIGLAAGIAQPASAVTVGFERITSNSSADASSQLSVDITDGGDGALLDFHVASGSNPDANIHEIYFDDGALFSPPPTEIASSSGVNFEYGSASPGELPGANGADPPFDTSAGLLADIASGPGGSANGLTVGETLIIKLSYLGGVTFADVISALTDGSFRIGLHVGSLLQGESDSFVSTPIPIPASLPLLLTALLGFTFLGRRRRGIA